MAGRVLVIGATGTVGSQLVTQLGQRGEKVRAATREPAAARRRSGGTAELVEFDFERPETFARALDGADRVFADHACHAMYVHPSVEVASAPPRRRWPVRPRRSLVREQSSGGPPIAFARFVRDSAACRT